MLKWRFLKLQFVHVSKQKRPYEKTTHNCFSCTF